MVAALSSEPRKLPITGNALDGNQLLTIEQVAEFLNIPIASVRKMRSLGKFAPGYKVGRHIRWRRSDILEWLESRADEI
jgi:excisionase family DNA binding protein